MDSIIEAGWVRSTRLNRFGTMKTGMGRGVSCPDTTCGEISWGEQDVEILGGVYICRREHCFAKTMLAIGARLDRTHVSQVEHQQR